MSALERRMSSHRESDEALGRIPCETRSTPLGEFCRPRLVGCDGWCARFRHAWHVSLATKTGPLGRPDLPQAVGRSLRVVQMGSASSRRSGFGDEKQPGHTAESVRAAAPGHAADRYICGRPEMRRSYGSTSRDGPTFEQAIEVAGDIAPPAAGPGARKRRAADSLRGMVRRG